MAQPLRLTLGGKEDMVPQALAARPVPHAALDWAPCAARSNQPRADPPQNAGWDSWWGAPALLSWDQGPD